MLKPFHTITLEDVILLDATKSANVLKKYWFIPLFLCRKELEKLAKQIFNSIGNAITPDISDEFEKLLSYRNLQVLELLHMAVRIEFDIKSRIVAWKIILSKDFKESRQLEKVLAEVKKHTGIQIEKPEDLQAFNDYVQYKIDKHAEMFPEQEQEKEEVNLSKVIFSVFNYMGQTHNRKMLLIDFVTMKQMAEEKLSQSKSTENGELE